MQRQRTGRRDSGGRGRGGTGLTAAQRAVLFRALQAACVELGRDTPDAREEYRKQVMLEETGKRHLAQLNRTSDFDAVMLRFAKDAGDYAAACKFATADDHRKAVLLRVCCAQVLQLKGFPLGSTDAADYLAGVVEQARIPCGRNVRDSSFWMDVAPDNLLTLFQILDTHRRRLLRARLDGRTAQVLVGFDPTAVYGVLPEGGLRICYDPRAYDSLTQVRVNVKGAVA